MQTAWRAAHTQGGCSVPQADVSIWQTRCSGIEAENQTAGAVEGCVIARYLVVGTKSRARSCAAAGSRFATAVRRSQALWWVGGQSRAGGQVRVAGLPIVVCAALASGLLPACFCFFPTLGRRKAQRGRRSGAVAGEVQRAGGQWVS